MFKPKLYSNHNDLVVESNHYVLKKYRDLIKWQNNESILEFGFGDGSYTKNHLIPMIPDDFKEYIGCDVSVPVLEYAIKTVNHPKMKFLLLDMCTEKVPKEFENRFDHIFCFYVMHWVRDPRQAYANVFNLLKPGGQIVFIYLTEAIKDEPYEKLSINPKWKAYEHRKFISAYYKNPDTEKAYEMILREIGFQISICSAEKREFYYFEDNFDQLMLAVNPAMENIPNEYLEDYKEDFLKTVKKGRMVTVVNDETGETKIRLDLNLMTVIATKPIRKQ